MSMVLLKPPKEDNPSSSLSLSILHKIFNWSRSVLYSELPQYIKFYVHIIIGSAAHQGEQAQR